MVGQSKCVLLHLSYSRLDHVWLVCVCVLRVDAGVVPVLFIAASQTHHVWLFLWFKPLFPLCLSCFLCMPLIMPLIMPLNIFCRPSDLTLLPIHVFECAEWCTRPRQWRMLILTRQRTRPQWLMRGRRRCGCGRGPCSGECRVVMR